MASRRAVAIPLAAAALMMVTLIGAQQRGAGPQTGPHGPATFKPTVTFAATTLAGWHPLGSATWKAAGGEFVGTAPAGSSGGWLVLDKGYQEVQLYASFKCSDPCSAGVLIRAAKTADGGLKGTFVSLAPGDLAAYTMTLDANGNELVRERLAAAARGQGAPPPAAARGEPARGRAGAGPPAGGRGRGVAPTLKPGDWNTVELLAAFNPQAPEGERIASQPPAPHVFRMSLNGGSLGSAELDAAGYGAIALYVGAGEARYKDVAFKDLGVLVYPNEVVSPYYTMQRISDYYYGWSAAIGDYNHDGLTDVASGPFYYPAPEFTERHRFRPGRVFNASAEYAPDMVNASADIDGDGWADIISSEMLGGRPLNLHINPRGEARTWDRYRILEGISTEIVLLKDLDGDARPEIIFGADGIYQYATYDPKNPGKLWDRHPIGTPDQRPINHGIGVGDVNADGRADLVVPAGWFEQPLKGTAGPWTFHAQSFGGGGGSEMGVYDVNGDGLMDVVTGLAAHGFGLSWFEQRRESNERNFVEHKVMGDYSESLSAGATFSELHASTWADMDGDGVPDYVVGKRRWAHLEGYNDPDESGPAVLYVFRTVRNPKAPGGAELVPELVHNHSGVGSHLQVGDLNKDGAMDIVTSVGTGTYIFFGKPAMQKKWTVRR
jgi:hypothetical protein